MRRCVTIRTSTAAGVAALLAAGVVVSTLLAAPTFAAASAAGPAASPTASANPTDDLPHTTTPTATGTPRTPTVTGTGSGSGSPTSSGSSTCFTWTPPTPGPGGPVQSWDFEDGTTSGWSASSGITVANSTDVASSGTHSLRVGGLTAAGDVGVTVDRMPTFGWYKATARLRLATAGSLPGGSAWVVLQANSSAAQSISGTARATTDGWTTITSYFRPSTLYADWYCNGTMTGTQEPAPTRIQLSLAVVACGDTSIDRPSTVYVDDAAVTSSGTGTGSPTPPPASSGPAPGCGTTSPPPPPPAQCVVTQTVQSQWAGGYVASLQVRNASSVALTAWTLRWTFPGAQTVTGLWGADTWSQSGQTVTVPGPTWAPLAANGGTATVGFLGQGVPGPLSSATLNGVTCGVPAL